MSPALFHKAVYVPCSFYRPKTMLRYSKQRRVSWAFFLPGSRPVEGLWYQRFHLHYRLNQCPCAYVCLVIKRSQDVNYQIIARAFICFNHLTDQAFIWDQAFNSIVVSLLPVKLLRQRKCQPALAENSSSLLSLTVADICFAWSFCGTLSCGVPVCW